MPLQLSIYSIYWQLYQQNSKVPCHRYIQYTLKLRYLNVWFFRIYFWKNRIWLSKNLQGSFVSQLKDVSCEIIRVMTPTKHSFLRELREVAPEMELFPENHSPYEKDFVTKSNPYAKFSARHFTKKFVSWRICQESGSPHFFDGNSLPNTTLGRFVWSTHFVQCNN